MFLAWDHNLYIYIGGMKRGFNGRKCLLGPTCCLCPASTVIGLRAGTRQANVPPVSRLLPYSRRTVHTAVGYPRTHTHTNKTLGVGTPYSARGESDTRSPPRNRRRLSQSATLEEEEDEDEVEEDEGPSARAGDRCMRGTLSDMFR